MIGCKEGEGRYSGSRYEENTEEVIELSSEGCAVASTGRELDTRVIQKVCGK